MRYPELESNTLELKREMPRNDQIIKTIIGFCNLHGGKIVIGVNDDRRIIGLPEKAIEEARESIDKAIFEACSPLIVPRLYAQRFGENTVLVIEVSAGMNKPYYRRSEGAEKGTYVRLGCHTMRANSAMIQELRWQSSGIDFERLPVYQATLADLDEKAIKAFLSKRKNNTVSNLDEQVLRAYHLIAYDQSKTYPSVLGILLFGRNPQHYFSEAMLICSHFSGTTGREVIATVDCEGTLFNQFKQAFAFVTQRLYRSFTIQGLKRSEKLEIPEDAIREALLNAIVHRNYHVPAPAKIAIYDDRVEIFSPGQFPGPLRPDNLKAGITYLRNPGLCKILREAHYIEKLGSGFITIFNRYAEYNLKTPQVIEGENYIKCILPREVENKVKSTTEAITTSSDMDKILELFTLSDAISISDVTQKLAVSKATAIRRMNALIQQKRIQRTGHTKNIRYRLVR